MSTRTLRTALAAVTVPLALLATTAVDGSASAATPGRTASNVCARTLSAYPVLEPGDRAPAVRTLQCALDDLGSDVAVDGHYGPQTRAAVRRIEDGFEGPRPHPGRIDAGFWTLLYGRQLSGPMHVGRHGHQVTVLQRALRAAGGRIVVDGDFGHQTRDVVRAYQRATHIEVTGRLDEQTGFYLAMGATF